MTYLVPDRPHTCYAVHALSLRTKEPAGTPSGIGRLGGRVREIEMLFASGAYVLSGSVRCSPRVLTMFMRTYSCSGIASFFCLFVVGYLEGRLCGLVLHGSSAL